MAERKRSFIFAFPAAVLTAVLAVSAAAQSPSRSAAVYTPLCNYQDLCYTLVMQARKALDAGGDFCAVPYEDRRHGLRRPDWRPVDPATAADRLSRVLPRLGEAVARITERMRMATPAASASQLRQAFWQRYGARLIEAIAAGRASLETARLDFDNASPKEQVYRVTHLEPVDKDKPDGPWRSTGCSGAGVDQPVPLYGIFLAEEDERRIGSPALAAALARSDLFTYRGRTYVVSPGGAGLEASWVRNLPHVGTAHLAPVAGLSTNQYVSK